MTRFYFDTNVGDRTERDTEGVDLPSEARARAEAKAALTDMARDHLPNGNHMGLRVTIRDEAGREIYSASLVMDAGPTPAKQPRS
jgi:hypothetical protein